MGPSGRAEMERLNAKVKEIQDRCTHEFISTSHSNLLRFHATERFGATCEQCTLRISFLAWDQCPQCLNDLSETEPTSVPGVFQGSGPVDDGQTYAAATLEKRCTCGTTVWKYKGE